MDFRFSTETENEGSQPGRLEEVLASFDAAEVEIVVRASNACERLGLTRIAIAATCLGNGWLYPIVTLVLLLTARIDAPLRFIITTASSFSLAFVVYPVLKTFIARARPCEYEPSLTRDPEPLDRYSCPSGHAMTASAYAVVVMFACPPATPFMIALCLVVSWSRVALGHHYVSDVIAGVVLGAGVAMSIGALMY